MSKVGHGLTLSSTRILSSSASSAAAYHSLMAVGSVCSVCQSVSVSLQGCLFILPPLTTLALPVVGCLPPGPVHWCLRAASLDSLCDSLVSVLSHFSPV